MTDKEKEDELCKWSFVVMGTQFEKDHLWDKSASGQLREVVGRLIVFKLKQFYQAEPDYPTELREEMRGIITLLIQNGFFIYCAEAVHITHEAKDILSVKPYNDPGLKDFLIKEIQPVIDGKKIKSELEPPTYVFNTVKAWWRFWIKEILPEDKAFLALQENNRAALLTQIPILIDWGYMVSILQKQYHDSQSNVHRVGG